MSNFLKRFYLVKRMIGQTVTVERLGERDPRAENFQGLYVPIPEYKIGLWLPAPNDTRPPAADV